MWLCLQYRDFFLGVSQEQAFVEDFLSWKIPRIVFLMVFQLFCSRPREEEHRRKKCYVSKIFANSSALWSFSPILISSELFQSGAQSCSPHQTLFSWVTIKDWVLVFEITGFEMCTLFSFAMHGMTGNRCLCSAARLRAQPGLLKCNCWGIYMLIPFSNAFYNHGKCQTFRSSWVKTWPHWSQLKSLHWFIRAGISPRYPCKWR